MWSRVSAGAAGEREKHLVHAGFIAAAEALAGELRAPVAEALAAHPGYALVVTGHSLGAAVASLVALLWAADDTFHTAYGDEKVANREIRVWHGATEKGP